MFSLSRIQFSTFAAMGSLVVLSTLGTPTRADELGQSSLPQFHTGPIAIGELDASIFEGTPDRFQRRGGASIRAGLDLAGRVSVDARALR